MTITRAKDSIVDNMSGFKLICSYKSNNSINVHKYTSINTGVTVYLADVDGPVVSGYFCIPTEAFDDDGLPHTLEHLIFIGSEKYPYKGVLDLLANRCLASGTNAWTDVDNTCYTLKTAGSEGFLTLMPIFLDHILYPTLKNAAYITEVHHITGEGEDAGIVYSEMQGTINSGERLTHTELLRAAYPGKCGYKSITGGNLPNLRESTSNEKVINYHKELYRPENLSIIITGQVKHADVFKALQPFEEKIISKGPRGPFKRPWQDEVSPLTESVDLDVCYPCDDEDNGLVIAGWRGPSSIHEFYDLMGCVLLLKYLTDTSVSPLQQEFVEIDDAYANNVVYGLYENSIPLFYLQFENVPTAKIPLIKDLLKNVLKSIASKADGIDMKRMQTVIYRYILEALSYMESYPHDTVSDWLIGAVLFGNTEEDLKQRLNQIELFKKLMVEPASYWLNILNKYLINAPIAISKGIPSIEKKNEIAEKEKERIAKQIENLGKEGLEKKKRELEEAIAENEKPAPDELLTSVPIPSTDSINFMHVKRFSTDSVEQHPQFDVNKLPLYTFLDHANTNFVYMFVTMDSSKVSKNLRPYIPLLLESILVCPLNRDGKLIPYENIVAELETDTVEITSGVGLEYGARFSCGDFSHAANLMLQLEVSKYAKGVQWIKELLYQTEFTPERLKVTGAKIINEVAQAKRNGCKIADDLLNGLLYKKESNHYMGGLLRQQKFLTKLLEHLETEEGQKEVVDEMNTLRKILTSPNSLAIYIAVNVDKLIAQNPDVYAPWKKHFSEIESSSKSKLNIAFDSTLMKKPEEISLNGCVTGLGSVESAYLVQSVPCIQDFLHPDLAPLLVYLQYLTQAEGPMWKNIRGHGLAYGYSLFAKPNDGLLYLSLYRATNVIGAYKEARAIIEVHLSKDKWEPTLFDSAKSSLVFKFINKEKTVRDMISQSLLAYYRNVPHDYNRQIIKNISAVSLEDAHRVSTQYVEKLLEPKLCKTTIVCHPSKVSEVAEAFNDSR
ncbi:uncharacterized protein C05D11.1-like isoform X2 [Belonocnema kinseyi]|uniref:uncharacterized protein C05D11.1-like isoform X2 n=1 Tax=Belonocnema kinseyi TaxID=2817044 RepID=UPI00143D69CB|nr:uncharacterized protein C05D11.1-like isoform X2 [Belonocnema kinseyi]